MITISKKKKNLVVVIITTLLLLVQSSRVSSWSLFQTVNVTFENQMKHAADLFCNAGSNDPPRVQTVMPGETVWWTVEDVLFPLVWCYLQMSDDLFGVFWGYQVKMKCGDRCEWRIRDDGLYFVPKDGPFQFTWLNTGAGGFV